MTGGHCGRGPSSLAQEEPYTLGEKDMYMAIRATRRRVSKTESGQTGRRMTPWHILGTRQPWCCVSNHGIQPWLNSILITIKAGTCHLQCLHYAASMRQWNLAVASVKYD
jgi:hypothetical protein